MKVLVTGSAGRIGAAICQTMASDYEVIGTDCQPGPHVDIVADINSEEHYHRALNGTEVVIHCAALHAPHVGKIPDSEFLKVNVEATEKLAIAAFEAGIEHFIFTSTTALYGQASVHPEHSSWITEQTLPRPKTIYHQTKIAAEARLQKISEQFQKPVTVLRMSRCFPEPVNLMAAYRLHRGIDKRDVVSAHLAALRNRLAGFQCFIISAYTPFKMNQCYTLKQNAPVILNAVAPELVTTFSQYQWPLPGSIDRIYDSSKAQKQLHWTPAYGFAEIISQWQTGDPHVLAPEF